MRQPLAFMIPVSVVATLALMHVAPLHADNARANAAYAHKDYAGAWREWLPAAQAGNAEAQAAIGSMLYQRQNPPGTGIYADAEEWLQRSATQNDWHGQLALATFYWQRGKQLNSGLNPGVNDYVSPQQRQQAEGYLARSRGLLERCVSQGIAFCKGNLAIFLDAGIGGPPDPGRAAQLRKAVSAGNTNESFAHDAKADPNASAMLAQWQQGKYANALVTARQRAQAGDAGSLALLGKAYYLGLGVPKDYAQARQYLTQAVNKNNADAMYLLGLMYEHGRGMPQDLPRATQLLDRAAALGQGYAKREVAGMRLQGESDAVAARIRAHKSTDDIACETAGGVSSPGSCLRGGQTIDPWNPN
jgi:hypothetical protein